MYNFVSAALRGTILASALAIGSTAFAATVSFGGPGFGVDPGATRMDLSSFTPGAQKGRTLRTNIGTFRSFGRRGGGGSVVGDTRSMQVRGEATYGRTDVPHLDSNDLHTIFLRLPKDTQRARLDFQDLADRPGSTFTLRAGKSYAQIVGRQKNGARNTAWLTFGDGDSRVVRLLMRGTSPHPTRSTRGFDGYSITNASVSVAPIPLPPAAALLGSGVLAMAGLRRRRKVRAAA